MQPAIAKSHCVAIAPNKEAKVDAQLKEPVCARAQRQRRGRFVCLHNACFAGRRLPRCCCELGQESQEFVV